MVASQDEASHNGREDPVAVTGGAGDSSRNARASNEDTASSIDGVTQKPEPDNRTRGQKATAKVQRHCAKYWLWHVVASIVLLAILLPITFTVIVPAIVQNVVNGQNLPVQGGALLALSPDQLMISLNTSLKTPLPVDVDPLILYFYNKNTTEYTPFTNITIPKSHVNHNTSIEIVNQTVTVTNHEEMVKWFNTVFELPVAKLSLRGRPHIHMGALSSRPHLDHTIDVPALDMLSGFGIKDLNIMLPPDDKGNNLKGTLNLPNWGSLTLGLGDLKLNLLSGKLNIGYVEIPGVVLPPGNNTRDFTGQLHLDVILKNIGAVIASQAAAIQNGQIELSATGNSSTINGQHIKYIEDVLNKKTIRTSVSIVALAGDLLTGVTGGGKKTLVDVLTDVLGNTTTISNIMGHFNQTSSGQRASVKPVNLTQAKRASPKASMAWGMLKLAMRMNMKDSA